METREEGATEAGTTTTKHFSRVRRELTAAELSTKGVQKMLLMHIDRLEEQIDASADLSARLAEAQKQTAVLEQKLDVSRGADLVFGVCLAIGALLLGLAPSLWSHQPQALIVLVSGGLIMLGGVGSRWLMR